MPAGANGTSARQGRMERSPPPGASPCKRPRTQLHYPPRKRSRLGEPATALGLSWDTVGGAGGAFSAMQFPRELLCSAWPSAMHPSTTSKWLAVLHFVQPSLG